MSWMLKDDKVSVGVAVEWARGGETREQAAPTFPNSYLGFSAWVLLLDFPLKQQKIKISHLYLFSCFREMK